MKKIHITYEKNGNPIDAFILENFKCMQAVLVSLIGGRMVFVPYKKILTINGKSIKWSETSRN